MNERLLIVEDEPALARSLTDRLASEGYRVDHESDGQSGFDAAKHGSYDAIVLDVMLPRLQGFDVCRLLRQENVRTPILMLTARGHIADKVTGLKLGADDYLTKPFEMVELLARIEALLRRARTADSASRKYSADQYEFGNILVDVRKAEVSRRGEQVTLSSREFSLLCYLLEHRGEALHRDTLLQDVWGYDDAPSTRTVDVHIGQLRSKLEENPSRPRHIVTVHGFGYKFLDGPSDTSQG